jgi:hypothetical protein
LGTPTVGLSKGQSFCKLKHVSTLSPCGLR